MPTTATSRMRRRYAWRQSTATTILVKSRSERRGRGESGATGSRPPDVRRLVDPLRALVAGRSSVGVALGCRARASSRRGRRGSSALCGPPRLRPGATIAVVRSEGGFQDFGPARVARLIPSALPPRPYNPRKRLALTPGTRLGVYEVTAQIGAGGMGEVYRARDTKLNRDVALKVLPGRVRERPRSARAVSHAKRRRSRR